MATKVRQYAPAMLHDGLAEAIRSIRERKGLKQSDAEKAAGLKPGRWSQYETQTKRLGLQELPIILKGLGCTETELWQEKVEIERRHYVALAEEIREPAPVYDALATGVLQGIYALDVEELPLEEQQRFERWRHDVAANVTSALGLVTRLKDTFRELKSKKEDDTARD